MMDKTEALDQLQALREVIEQLPEDVAIVGAEFRLGRHPRVFVSSVGTMTTLAREYPLRVHTDTGQPCMLIQWEDVIIECSVSVHAAITGLVGAALAEEAA